MRRDLIFPGFTLIHAFDMKYLLGISKKKRKT
jgi:hypothetical protein